MLAKIKPTRCIIVFDGKDGTKKRRKLFPQYKKSRKVKQKFNRNVDWGVAPHDEEESIKLQLSKLVHYLEHLPVTLICIDGTEADDIIAYIANNVLPESEIIIASTDKDFFQLINERINVWSPSKKIKYNKQKIQEEYGIPASNFLTYKILLGDQSDNISGIKGAGLKTIKKYIEPIIQEENFDIKKLIEFVKPSDSKYKVIQNIKNDSFLLKRNYVLMQLMNVDLSNHVKLRTQEAVRKDIPQLIKYKFSTLFIQDKLWSQIPNLDNWVLEFVRLDKFRHMYKNNE
jgi:DNA polymerase-1